MTKNDIIKKGSIVKYIDGKVYIVYKVKDDCFEIEPIELSQKCIFDARHAQLELLVGNELKGALSTL